MRISERVWADISLDAVEENFAMMRAQLRPDTRMVAVIKADAYGHGAIPIARLLEDHSYIWGYAVATAEEALSLRRARIRKPILILGLVGQESLVELAQEEIRIAVSSYELARAYARAGEQAERRVYVHLAVDTGMSRIGFADRDPSVEEIKKIWGLKGLTVEGAFTHFARGDEEDISPALVQLERFQAFIEKLKEHGLSPQLCHCSNSAGILRLPEANLSMVRAGITIYGIYPSGDVAWKQKLSPVMELKSHLTLVKEVPAGTAVSYGGTYVAPDRRVLATVPVGYADGYPRLLSGKGEVLIHGKRARICGRVCMDQFMVDVTDIPDVQSGDLVTLMGRDGEEFIGVEELSGLCGRFPYEFVCCVSHRVPRRYIHHGQVEQVCMGMPLGEKKQEG